MRQHIINVLISPALCPECSAGPRTGAGYGIVRRERDIRAVSSRGSDVLLFLNEAELENLRSSGLRQPQHRRPGE
jgi:hypothetical protein